jgi:hypothetical protein
MENKLKHMLAAFIFLLPIWYLSDLRFPDILNLSILTIWSDLDIIVNNVVTIKGKEVIGFDHRDKWMHSILYPLTYLLWGSIVNIQFLIGFLYSVSVHLLCDLPWKYWLRDVLKFFGYKDKINKPRGTYCCFPTYKGSTRWYIMNTVVGFIISIMYFIG